MFNKHHTEKTKEKISKAKKGKKSSNYIDGRTNKKYYCKICNNKISIFSGIYQRGICWNCSRKEVGKKIRGKNHGNWQDGKSFEEYGAGFDNALKEQVRFRDKYKCQVCGCSQLENGRQFDVHHINYNKKNNNINNLIALCISCHTKTGINRNYWKKYFNEVI